MTFLVAIFHTWAVDPGLMKNQKLAAISVLENVLQSFAPGGGNATGPALVRKLGRTSDPYLGDVAALFLMLLASNGDPLAVMTGPDMVTVHGLIEDRMQNSVLDSGLTGARLVAALPRGEFLAGEKALYLRLNKLVRGDSKKAA